MRSDRQALCLMLQDGQGQDVGGLVLLDQGHRQLRCDWFGGCTHLAVAAIVPSTRGAAPQLACGMHLANMHLAIWKPHNPPRLVVKNAARLLARNDQVKAAS